MNFKNCIIFVILFISLYTHISQCNGKENSPSVEIIPIPTNQLAEMKDNKTGDLKNQSQNYFYHLHLNEFPKLQKIILTIKRPSIDFENNTNLQTTRTFVVLENGKILDSSKNEPEELIINSKGYLPAEKILLQFQPVDEKFHHELSIIPLPIISESKNHKFSIEAELISTTLDNYHVRIKGLQDNQLYLFTSKSGDEELKQLLNYSDFKEMWYAPAVIRKSEGMGEFTISTLDKDIVSIQLPWGNYLKKMYRKQLSYQDLIKKSK